MKRFFTRTLTGRLIGVMLMAVALSQGISLLVHHYERMNALRWAIRDECLGRVASAYRLTLATPIPQRAQILENSCTPLTRYWLTPEKSVDAIAWQHVAREKLLMPLPGNIKNSGSINRFKDDPVLSRLTQAHWVTLPPDSWMLRLPVEMVSLEKWNGFGFAVQLDDGTWLNTAYAKPDYLVSPTVTPGYYAALGFTIIIFLTAAFYVARRISRPLQRLSRAADRFGRGEDVELIPEEGPDDIRCTVAAFNRMQVRLRRFVEDRTRMLAAIGHDLRTPITSLRLRSEFVTDPEVREKLLSTLDEMQSMTEAALSFARSESTAEPTRKVDLTALLESLCDDLVELGWKVEFAGGERITCTCRPDAIRRAIRNIIENAVRYGDRARVMLQPSTDGVTIIVEDDGAGIPEAEWENVFGAFVRLEASRNRNTGGVGLGLSIARSIFRAHGGDVSLAKGNTGFQVRLSMHCG